MEWKISTDGISEKESISYYLGIFIISSIYAIIAVLVNNSPVDSAEASVALHYFLDTVIMVLGVISIIIGVKVKLSISISKVVK